MRDGKHIRDHTSDIEENLGAFEQDIRNFRASVRKCAERPDFFWKKQHSAILANLNKPVPAPKGRPGLLWAPVALGVILCILFFVESSKAPTPDYAAGSDQELLIGIERALSRNYPEAFDPAVVIFSSRKIETNRDEKDIKNR